MNTDSKIFLYFLFFIFFFVPFQAAHKPRVERTFALIKSKAIQAGRADDIVKIIQRAGFTIVASKKIIMTEALLEKLYEQYTLRTWFRRYIKSAAALPAIVMILEKTNAVHDWDVLKHKIRKKYGEHLHNNSVHGSDTLREAGREIKIFFPEGI